MYAHLFDYDNYYINRIEGIIDRFLEILNINEEPKHSQIRMRLIDFIGLKALLTLLTQLPKAKQDPIASSLNNKELEKTITALKSEFSDQTILTSFHKATRDILEEKIHGLPKTIGSKEIQELNDLMINIEKY